jgi:hypothetical protein
MSYIIYFFIFKYLNRCLDPSGTRLVCGCEDHTIVTVDLPDFDALRTARAAQAAPPDEGDADAVGGDGGEGVAAEGACTGLELRVQACGSCG